MKRCTSTLTALLLAAWAVVGYGGLEIPEMSAPGSNHLANADAKSLLEQFDRLQKTLHDPTEQSQSLQKQRRLLGEAQELLAAARELLVSEHQRKKTQLEEEIRALDERSRHVKADWDKRPAQPARVPQQASAATKPPTKTAEHVVSASLLVVNPPPYSTPIQTAIGEPDWAAPTPTDAALHAIPTPLMNGTPQQPPATLRMEQTLDIFLSRLERLEQRLRTLSALAGPTVGVSNLEVASPAPLANKGATVTATASVAYSPTLISKTNLARPKTPPKTPAEQKLDAMLTPLDSLEKRLAELEKGR